MTGDARSLETHNKELIRTGFDKWVAGTGGVLDLFAPDAQRMIVGNAPVSRTHHIKRGFIDQVIMPFGARMFKRFINPNPRAEGQGDAALHPRPVNCAPVLLLYVVPASSRDQLR
jgi:hypothetical protein